MSQLPADVRRYSLLVSLGLVLCFGALGFAIGATQDDPGDGAFRGDYGRQTVTGVLRALPYPTVRITAGSEQLPVGHTLMLSGGGKRGVQGRAEALDGQLVTVSGTLLERGALDMLQLRGGDNGMRAAEGDAAVPDPEPLGRWRLRGEICDGKCLAGAMRPGRGIAHNACAQLCLVGGVPPVFVSTGAVEGQQFMLMGDAAGGPLSPALLARTATSIELEGHIERRGDLLVLLVDGVVGP